MKFLFSLLATLCLAGAVSAQGDSSMRSVQQALKDGGFYYGEITGQKNADTTAAIRRYQIRNGLEITGELNAQTQKSLGVKGGSSAPSKTTPPAPRFAAPRPLASAPPAPDTSDLRAGPDGEDEEAPPLGRDPRLQPPANGYGNGPGPQTMTPSGSGVFAGTPYEMASPDVQRQIIVGAQSLLLRAGLYRSGIDGIYGPGMQLALQAHQARIGLPPSGRFDFQTLRSLGLLPGQRRGGFVRRPGWPAPARRGYGGEQIYIPR
ncbi:MAG: peptidoglycan-binding domain-containing protein [Chthoniobacterales bacterium]